MGVSLRVGLSVLSFVLSHPDVSGSGTAQKDATTIPYAKRLFQLRIGVLHLFFNVNLMANYRSLNHNLHEPSAIPYQRLSKYHLKLLEILPFPFSQRNAYPKLYCNTAFAIKLRHIEQPLIRLTNI